MSRRIAFEREKTQFSRDVDWKVAIMSTRVYQNILMEAIIVRRIVYFQLDSENYLSRKSLSLLCDMYAETTENYENNSEVVWKQSLWTLANGQFVALS